MDLIPLLGNLLLQTCAFWIILISVILVYLGLLWPLIRRNRMMPGEDDE
jgi:hypothetical protein